MSKIERVIERVCEGSVKAMMQRGHASGKGLGWAHRDGQRECR